LKNLSLSLLLLISFTSAQQSGSAFYKSAVMNGNNIKTVFGNWGVIGQPTDNRPRGAWLKESNGYIGDNSFFLGIELPIKDYNNDGKPDTIHSVITCPITRPASVFDTDDKSGGGKPFSFMPVDGFFNPDKKSIAISNDPTTWPILWGNNWKGINGNNEIVADLESYFQMDDQNDERFSSAIYNSYKAVYKPDTLNLERKGQGIRVDVRYLQYNHPLFNDIFFRVYDITNESSYDYQKVFFGYLNGTLIGLTGNQNFNEYDDDYSILYKKENVVIAGDFGDNVSRNPFWSGPVGKTGEGFLESDSNGLIASYLYFTPANNIPIGSDEEMWKHFIPGSYKSPQSIVNDTVATMGHDGDYLFGSKYFSLKSKNSKQKKRIVSAIAYGYSPNEIFQKIKLGRLLAKNNFNITATISHSSIPQFEIVQSLSGNMSIQWPSNNPTETVDIYFSPDAGKNWQTVAEDIPNNGNYSWNTAQYGDCSFGKLRLFIKNASGVYSTYLENKKYFSINNVGNGTPFIKILSDLKSVDTVKNGILSLRILVGDPDNKNLLANISYSLGEGFTIAEQPSITSDTVEQNLQINLGKMPNSEKFRLKIDISDGNSIWSDSTDTFVKNTPRNGIANSNITSLSGTNQSKVKITVVDKSQTTAETYVISFVDTSHNKPKTLSVYNKTKNIPILSNVELLNKTESPVFAGLRLSIDDDITKYDTSYWSRKDSISPNIYFRTVQIPDTNSNVVYGYPKPIDYQIIYGVKSRTIDLKPYLGYTTPKESIDVAIVDKKSQERIEFAYVAQSNNFADFYLVEKILEKKRLTWYINVHHNNPIQGLPKKGDTITITTKKGISIYDSLLIKDVALAVPESNPLPRIYSLYQNYPNPFNPTTTIQYSIPVSAVVTIKVFDILGREVKTLINDYKTPGIYSAELDASMLSSGIYFYKMTSAHFTEVKKMVLVR